MQVPPKYAVALVSTVAENEKEFSKRKKRHARRAR